MNIKNLIELAKENSGLSLGELADDLGKNKNRISEWRAGKQIPDANEIAYFANKAGLPVFETVAEIEASLNSKYAPIWQAALGKLRAAGVTACIAVAVTAGSLTVSDPAFSAEYRGSKTSVSAKSNAQSSPVARFFWSISAGVAQGFSTQW